MAYALLRQLNGEWLMKRQNSSRSSRILIFAITIFAGFSNVTANAKTNDVAAGAKAVSQQTIAVIAANLTKKLRADLANDSVVVKISDVEKYQASENGIEIKGSGVCVITDNNNQLPIRFETKINAQSQVVGSIKYDFIQFETSESAPSSTEEILMKEIMKKVGNDYKTDNIVISIDGFETVETAEGKEFVGDAEIKIGEVEWKKIKFDVVLRADNQAAKIKYDIQK